jgi:hypothetical protein
MHLHYKYHLVNAVYSENYTKPIKTLSGQSDELLHDKAGGTNSYHWILSIIKIIVNSSIARFIVFTPKLARKFLKLYLKWENL